MTRTVPFGLPLLLLPLAACAGAGAGYGPAVAVHRTDVTPDEGDREERPPSGSTAEAGPAVPRAERADARLAAVTAAPKRAPSDLLVVALLPLQGNAEVQLVDGEYLFAAYRDAFLGHAVLRPVDDVRVADAWNAARERGQQEVEVPADALVDAEVERSGAVVTLRGTVRSAYDDTSRTVEVAGNLLDVVFERFVTDVEAALLEEIGPTVPVRSDHLRRTPHLEAHHRRALERGR